jgi:co-chaperonin GroES (HSP10)
VQLLRNHFLLSVDADAKKTLGIGLDGKNLYVDTDFNPHLYSTKVGVVVGVPKVISGDYINDVVINVGDKVLFHHFVAMKDNEMIIDGIQYFKCEYQFLYGRVEGDVIVPFEDYVFVRKVKSDDKDKFVGKFQISFDEGDKMQYGEVVAGGRSGLVVGDKVSFTHNSDYPIEVNGEELCRMRSRKITLVDRNGKIVSFGDRLLLKRIFKKVRFESFRDKYLYGEVLEGNERVPTGCEVSFNKGMSEVVLRDGVEYYLIREKFINYIL